MRHMERLTVGATTGYAVSIVPAWQGEALADFGGASNHSASLVAIGSPFFGFRPSISFHILISSAAAALYLEITEIRLSVYNNIYVS